MADQIIPAARGFYVYLHRRATDGRVFYVGKGTGYRSTKTTQSRSPHWRNIVKKHGFTVEYVIDDVQEWYAFELERELIAYYGREALCNLTDGGDGVSGMRHTAQSKAAIGRASRGKRPPEFGAASSARQKGVPKSEDSKRKISATLKGRRLPAEHLAKTRAIAQARKGVPRPEALEGLRAYWRDPANRQKQSVAITQAAGARAVRVRCVETGHVFERMRHADDWLRSMGLLKSRQSTITAVCRGKQATCGGYRWEYATHETSD